MQNEIFEIVYKTRRVKVTGADGKPMFITERTGKRLGIFVGALVKDKCFIGVAKCKKTDRFNFKFGKNMAWRRILAQAITGRKSGYPFSFEHNYNRFLSRCKSFFKSKDVCTLPRLPMKKIVNKSDKVVK